MAGPGGQLGTRTEPVATADGGIRLEWNQFGDEYIVEIEPTGGLYLCVLRGNGQDEDRAVSVFSVETLTAFCRTGELPPV